jgi:putative copper export protein
MMRGTGRASRLRAQPHFRLVSRLSSAATLAFGGVLATGVCSAFSVMRPVPASALPHSLYAWLLGAKLALIALATLLAGVNRIHRLPLLADMAARVGTRTSNPPDSDANRKAARAFDRTLLHEAVLLLLVVITAAVLGQTAPPTP